MRKKTIQAPTALAEDLSTLSDLDVLARLLETEAPDGDATLPPEELLSFLWCDFDKMARPFGEPSSKLDHLLTATMDLARDVAFGHVDLAKPLGNFDALARYLFLNYSRRHGDAVLGLYMDEKGAWLDDQLVFFGDAQRNQVRVAEVLGPAIDCGAQTLALAHVRAYGKPFPTKAELERTGQVGVAARVLGLALVDSWVVAPPTGFATWGGTRGRQPRKRGSCRPKTRIRRPGRGRIPRCSGARQSAWRRSSVGAD